MRNLLKKLSIVLICTVILIFFVAAGADEAGIRVAESVTGGKAVFLGLFTAWLLIIGVMCRTMENIPGVRVKQSRSATYKN